MTTQVAITGATGFIGSHTVEYALKQGYRVLALSRDRNKAQRMPWYDKVVFHEMDLNQPDGFDYTLLENTDYFLHVGWQGLPDYRSLDHLQHYLPCNLKFITNLIGSGVKDISVVGTCFEYGLCYGPLGEEEPTKPVTPYGLAKDSLRKTMELLKKTENFRFKWLRLFFMYGPGQHPKSLFSQLEKAIENEEEVFPMSGGEQLRDFLPVEKVAKYLVEAGCQSERLGIINCCSGEPVSVRKLVENILEKRGSEMKLNLGHYPYPAHEPMAFWGQNDKLRSLLK